MDIKWTAMGMDVEVRLVGSYTNILAIIILQIMTWFTTVDGKSSHRRRTGMVMALKQTSNKRRNSVGRMEAGGLR